MWGHFSNWRLLRAALAVFVTMFLASALHAQENVDVIAYFARIESLKGAGLVRKTKPIDVRPARPREIIVTTIKGEGKETKSAPAKDGDMVVRNRCPETGNEEYLVSAAVFAVRYEDLSRERSQTAGSNIARVVSRCALCVFLRAKMRSPFWPLGEKKW